MESTYYNLLAPASYGGFSKFKPKGLFLPCTTSPAIFNPVFKASRSMVFVPFFNKGMAALKSPPKIRQQNHD
jgi:hypothetical protein